LIGLDCLGRVSYFCLSRGSNREDSIPLAGIHEIVHQLLLWCKHSASDHQQNQHFAP
jgi:hypothetical protein